jgi:hypothetical protein
MPLRPPICSAPAALPLYHPVRRFHQLLVDCCFFLTKWRPPKANAPPISLFFDAHCIVVPNKGTSCHNRDPSAGRLQRTHREQQCNDLGVRLPYYRARAKPLDGATEAARFGCCVLCVCLWLYFVCGSNF